MTIAGRVLKIKVIGQGPPPTAIFYSIYNEGTTTVRDKSKEQASTVIWQTKGRIAAAHSPL